MHWLLAALCDSSIKSTPAILDLCTFPFEACQSSIFKSNKFFTKFLCISCLPSSHAGHKFVRHRWHQGTSCAVAENNQVVCVDSRVEERGEKLEMLWKLWGSAPWWELLLVISPARNPEQGWDLISVIPMGQVRKLEGKMGWLENLVGVPDWKR